MKSSQRGGFAIGLIVGLLIGLALALGVALYVTKAPNPFINKVPTRPAGLDAAEAERNRNWDPNSPLAGKNPARPSAASGVVAPAAPPTPGTPTLATPGTSGTPESAVAPAAPAPRAAQASAPSSGREAALATKAAAPLSSATGPEPFTYFVQAGAYSRSEDAEQQRAKLAMLGLEARLSEREQAGRTVYRVRAGPFGKRDEADAAKQKLNEAGVESALVRVQK